MGGRQPGTMEEEISLTGLHEAQPHCPMWGPGSSTVLCSASLWERLWTSELLGFPSQPRLCLKMGNRTPGCHIWAHLYVMSDSWILASSPMQDDLGANSQVTEWMLQGYFRLRNCWNGSDLVANSSSPRALTFQPRWWLPIPVFTTLSWSPGLEAAL